MIDRKFREIEEGEIFSQWKGERIQTLIKISASLAIDLRAGTSEKINPNKSCSPARKIEINSTLAEFKGEICLAKPFNKDRVMLQYVIVLGGEVRGKDEIKFLAPESPREKGLNLIGEIKKHITNSSILLDALEIMGE